jgi:hypothetical protein
MYTRHVLLGMSISGVQVTTVRDSVEMAGVVARAVLSEQCDLADDRRSLGGRAQRRGRAAAAESEVRVRPLKADPVADHGAVQRQ